MPQVLGGRYCIPVPGSGVCERPHLEQHLQSLIDSETRIITVTASSGHGKTTLVAQWAQKRQEQGHQTAWLTLDDADTHSSRFWPHLEAALANVTGLSTKTPATISVGLPTDTELIDGVIERQFVFSSEFTIVIDNCECLTDRDLQRELDYFIKHCPSGVVVILLGRAMPALDSLYRADLWGVLGRIGPQELVFRRREIELLIKPVTGEVDTLVRETEGWPAAVALFRRSANLGPNQPGFRNDWEITETLCKPIFEAYPYTVRKALKVMALIEPFTGDDLEAVSLTNFGRQLLEDCQRRTGLLVPENPHEPQGGYRLHRMFGRYLKEAGVVETLVRTGPIHAKAAKLRLSQNDHVRSLRHASLSRDASLLRETLTLSGLHLLWRNQSQVLASMLKEMRSADTAEVSLLDTLILFFAGDAEAAQKWFGLNSSTDVDTSFGPDFTALLSGMRAQLHINAGNFEAALQILETLETGPSSTMQENTTYFVQNLHASALICSYRYEEAETTTTSILGSVTEHENPLVFIDATIAQAALYSARENFPMALKFSQRALEASESQGLRYHPRLHPAHLIAAWSAYLSLDGATSARHLAYIYNPKSGPLVLAHSKTKLGLMLDFASNDRRATAAEQLMELVRHDSDPKSTPQEVACCSLQLADMFLGLRRPDKLAVLKKELREGQGISGELHLITARELIVDGQLERARKLLRSLTSESVPFLSILGQTTAWALLANVEVLMERPFKARAAFERALTLAAEHGTLRAFAYLDPVSKAAIDRERAHFPWLYSELGNIRRFGTEESLTVGPPLTPREYELLLLLTSLATTRELAHDLQISTNTVKTHVKSIYRKLGVTTRRDAISAAIDLEMLKPEAVSKQAIYTFPAMTAR